MPWSDGLVATLTRFLSYGGVRWWAAQLIPQAKSAVPGRLSKRIWTRPPYGWRNDVARCHALLGVLATPARRRRHLIQAQSYFCRAHQIKDLPNPELACAGLERGRGHSAGARHRRSDAAPHRAPQDAAHSGRRAGAARPHPAGPHRRAGPGHGTAGDRTRRDDLYEAPTLARSCGYAWAEPTR
jgi:hypothetical protein